ncbi:MAG: hypothetical protein JW900_03530 [Anaerolineae bacterium]|nr:hypothetical protein [Anaerolineae bacterium]
MQTSDEHKKPACLLQRLGNPFRKTGANQLRQSWWAHAILLFLCGVSLLVALLIAGKYIADSRENVRVAREQAADEAHRAATTVDDELRILVALANSLTEDLSSGRVQREWLEGRLRRTMVLVPELYGIGVAFEPRGPGDDLHAPYYIRQGDELQLVQIEDSYAYNSIIYDWYHLPLSSGTAMWQEPYYDPASDALLAEYTIPFEENGRAAGVVRINYTLDDIASIVDSLELGRAGYVFLLSKEGHFVYHPTRDYVERNMTIFDLAARPGNDVLQELGERAVSGESGYFDIAHDEITGKPTWVFVEPLSTPGWSMGVVFIEEEVVFMNDLLRRELIWVNVASVVFITCLSALLFQAHRYPVTRNAQSLWYSAFACAAALILGIATIWYLALTSPYQGAEELALLDQRDLGDYLITYTQAEREASPIPSEEPVTYVPTGIFVQSIEFSSANKVEITGYIWQKYRAGAHDGLSRGFLMPDAVSSEVSEAYRYQEGDVEVIGWYFESTLRQQFSFARYPFDQRNVRIRLWHIDFERNIILVPDLDSYEVINPPALPGLKEEITMPGWAINASFFSYLTDQYEIKFGLQEMGRHGAFPDLSFNISARQEFVDPFVINIIPLGAVIFLLYTILIASARRGEEKDTNNVLSVLRFGASMLFVVVIAHVRLRELIAGTEIIYLEYFYIIEYLVIVLTSLNSLILGAERAPWFIEYRSNLIPKVVYWPLALTMLLVITLIVFY